MNEVSLKFMVGGFEVVQIRSNGKSYVPVFTGDIFELHIQNNTNDRILAVVSVDGLSVMNGKPAKYSDTGYIVGANRTAKVKGYRQGVSFVREFVVGYGGESYAHKMTGASRNNGVIGVAFKFEANMFKEAEVRCSANLRGGPRASSRVFSCTNTHVGTQMGNKKHSEVKEVNFVADESRNGLIVLYYDTPIELVHKGVISSDYALSSPNPFPEEPRHMYCPDV